PPHARPAPHMAQAAVSQHESQNGGHGVIPPQRASIQASTRCQADDNADRVQRKCSPLGDGLGW
ncbi:MAG TPA: hypothetical protein VH575_10790, partial [Gemmataceae bacterium]